MKSDLYRRVFRYGALGVLLVGLSPFAGCERREKVLDVETPQGQVEVERNVDTGEVDVEVVDEN